MRLRLAYRAPNGGSVSASLGGPGASSDVATLESEEVACLTPSRTCEEAMPLRKGRLRELVRRVRRRVERAKGGGWVYPVAGRAATSTAHAEVPHVQARLGR